MWQILLCAGFSPVAVDGIYIFDDPSVCLMIQGLAEAHNADVLLEPPVQTLFYSCTRLMVECKDYTRLVGLNTLRSALGLREDVNHFNIVDSKEQGTVTFAYGRILPKPRVANNQDDFN